MTSLRSRLSLAIVLVVALCIGLTVGVGLVLTRRAVDKATLLDVSHQADLIATSQNVNSTILPLSKLNILGPYFKKQHLTPLRHFDELPQSAKDKLAHNKPADGSVTITRRSSVFRRADRQWPTVGATAPKECNARALDAVRVQPLACGARGRCPRDPRSLSARAPDRASCASSCSCEPTSCARRASRSRAGRRRR